MRALWACGAGDEPASSFSRTSAQFTGGSPSAAPKLMMSTTSPFLVFGGLTHGRDNGPRRFDKVAQVRQV